MFSFRQLFRYLQTSRNKRRATSRHQARRSRPAVEALENRLVPAITTAFNAGVLTISLSAAGDQAFVQVEGDGGIGVSNEATPIPIPFHLPIIGVPLPVIFLADQTGVTSIVVQDTSPTASALSQEAIFYGMNGFPQNISTTNIETVDVNQFISGTINGNASTVNIASPGTIQSGVDFAASGATVNVSGGSYAELVTVNKTLRLNGSYAGVDARMRLQIDETIVNGPGPSFTLAADNIVLDGFTLGDGTNPSHQSIGILTSASFSGYQIRNNIIESNDVGLSLASSGTNQTLVEQNWIESNGTGVNTNQGMSNVLVENNLLSGPQTGVNLTGANNLTLTNNSFQDGNNLQLSGVTNSTVSNNQFSGSQTSINQFQGDTTPLFIPTSTAVILGGDANITIAGNSFADRGWQAIQVADLGIGFGANSNIAITDNVINQNVAILGPNDGTAALIDLNGLEGTTTVDGNIVSFSGQVSAPRPGDVYGLEIEGAATTTVNVTNNQFDGNDTKVADGVTAGIELNFTLPVTAVINIQYNDFNGYVWGVYANSLQSGTQVHVNFNDISGNSSFAVLNQPVVFASPGVVGIGFPVSPPLPQPPPDIFDLQDNWWGVTSATAIAALIQGNPTPDAWLTSGLDTEPYVTGFQPDMALIFNGSATADQAPSLTPVPDQNRNRNQGPFTLTLSASGPGGNAVTFSAFLPSQVALELHQQLQLSLDPGGLYTNCFGSGENWLRGVTNQFGNSWYFILPAGELYAWDGGPQAAGTRIGTLTPTFAMNPSLLYQPQAPPQVQVNITGSQLTIDPGTYAGTFEVVVEATDGRATSTTNFKVAVTNRPPVITQTPNQTMTAGQNQLVLPITATDADNDPLSYSAVAGNMGYVLKREYNLSFANSLYLNYGGAQEKWLEGSSNQYGNPWYFIKPTGQFFAWNGTIYSATGTLLATVDPIFYKRPDLVYNAQDQSLAYVLNQSLNLTFTGNYYQNYGGAGEKWLQGNVNEYGNSWYFITPGGQLWAWNGARNQATGSILANLDTIDYNQPQLLYAAQGNAVSVSLAGNVLTINRTPGYLGSFDVLVLVRDGLATTTERFHVTAN